MQFTTIFTFVATASLALAVAEAEPHKPKPYPTKPAPAPAPSPSSGCQNGNAGACCTGFGQLFGINCVLNIFSNTCSIGSTACCPTSGQTGIINIGSICIPITI